MFAALKFSGYSTHVQCITADITGENTYYNDTTLFDSAVVIRFNFHQPCNNNIIGYIVPTEK